MARRSRGERGVDGVDQGDVARITPGAAGAVADEAEAQPRVRVGEAEHGAVAVVAEGARTGTERPHAGDRELEAEAETVGPAENRVFAVGLDRVGLGDDLRREQRLALDRAATG